MSTVGPRGPALLAAGALVLAGCSTAPPEIVAETTAKASTQASTQASAQASATAPTTIAPARRASSVLEPEAPTRATLPSGAVVEVRPATTKQGRLAVPPNSDVAGWWEGGSRVGDPFGSMLVAAHVDSTARGLGPFSELLTVGRGDRIVVGTTHLHQEFRVESLRLVPQGPLTDEQWLFSASGAHRLTLVTCAPPYDKERGGYQNLVVVTAVPVGPPIARGAP